MARLQALDDLLCVHGGGARQKHGVHLHLLQHAAVIIEHRLHAQLGAGVFELIGHDAAGGHHLGLLDAVDQIVGVVPAESAQTDDADAYAAHARSPARASPACSADVM